MAAISLRNTVTARQFRGTSQLLTNYEPVAVYLKRMGQRQGTRTMADRGALKIVGFIFATATLAVMLVAGMVVKGYADGAYTLEASTVEAAR
nr:hypothetical protein BDOA9_0120470 [Bradyrhizobium sp. DOA9]